jgi:hypothetical protein
MVSDFPWRGGTRLASSARKVVAATNANEMIEKADNVGQSAVHLMVGSCYGLAWNTTTIPFRAAVGT